MATRGVRYVKRERDFARWMFNRTVRSERWLWSDLLPRERRRWTDLARDLLITGLDAESLMEHL